MNYAVWMQLPIYDVFDVYLTTAISTQEHFAN